MILAADFGLQAESQSSPGRVPPESSELQGATEMQEETDERSASAEVASEHQSRPDQVTPSNQQPRVVSAYTAPSAEVRQATLAQDESESEEDDQDELSNAGRELAEAAAGRERSFVGRPGLSATQPTVTGVVASRPGLQEGPATGLGFASPFNLLTPQTNPLSGANGRCMDLANAGFFGGSRPACETHFRRP